MFSCCLNCIDRCFGGMFSPYLFLPLGGTIEAYDNRSRFLISSILCLTRDSVCYYSYQYIFRFYVVDNFSNIFSHEWFPTTQANLPCAQSVEIINNGENFFFG